MTQNSKDIDLFDLFVRFILFIRKRFLIILLVCILGTSLGFVRFLLTSNEIKSTFIGYSYAISNEIIIETVKNIKQDISTGNKNLLAQKLDILVEETDKLKNIEAYTINNTKPLLFKIIFISNDSLFIEKFKTGILKFINNHNYIKAQSAHLKNQKHQMLVELTRKLHELDSLQKLQLKENSNKLLTVNSYYTEYIDLFEKKINLENEYNSIDESNLIKEYYFNSENILSSSLKYLLMYFFLSLIAGFIIAFCIELGVNTRNYVRANTFSKGNAS